MPKIFEVRWSENSHQLLRAILVSWHAIILYFEQDDDAKAIGFDRFLKKCDNLKKIAFLGDVFTVFKRLQEKLQSNSLTLLDLRAYAHDAISSLEQMKIQPLLSGFEHTLQQTLVNQGDKVFLKGIELETQSRSRAAIEKVEIFRERVVNCLVTSLDKRLLRENSELLSIIEGLVKFDGSANIEEVHELLGADLDMTALFLQYGDLCRSKAIANLSLHKVVENLASPERLTHFREIAIVLARIVACTPHSADVERSISANNLLKTNIRSSLALTTENKYLYIYFNLPVLEKWCPKNAIVKWLEKSRRERSNTTDTSVSKNQRYFKGVFVGVDVEGDDVSDDVEQLNSQYKGMKFSF